MKNILLILLSFTLSVNFLDAQELSPDKFINALKKEDSAYAFTIPGWLVKAGGRIAINQDNMEYKEREMIRELTTSIKKLRFVVSQTLPSNFDEKLIELKNYMSTNSYEPLISVREEENDINLWAKFDGEVIERMVISIISNEDESVVFNIKSDLDMDRLKKMEFFKEWSSL